MSDAKTHAHAPHAQHKAPPPLKRSITPREIRALREEVPEAISSEDPLITDEEAEDFIRRITPSQPPRQ